MKKVVETTGAPKAFGPYSQGIIAGNLLFISGQIPIDPMTGEFINGDIGVQTRRIMANIGAILRSQGLDFSDLVKVTIFLTDMGQFDELNSAYERYVSENPPARSCVQVSALPKGALLEIEAIALMQNP